MHSSELTKGLNKPQAEAVVNTEGPTLVIAGAGSGKTRVLTHRIANLLAKGTPAFKILSLTFTNKAAKEMKERIALLVGEETAKNLWMGTFHSIFARILRRDAYELGYPSNFTIYDTADSKNLLKSIIKELKLDDKKYKVNEVLGRISSAKNNLITPSAYAGNTQIQTIDRNMQRPEIARIYNIYANRCYNSGVMDFDDLLLQTNILFRDHPEILQKYQNFFSYILVDEYQDTNFSQYLIVKKLAEKHGNVCVVGDDAQSIYSFRGAKIENILNFRNDYPNYNHIKLEQNYRSTQTIVLAANSIIKNNKKQIPKNVFSENEAGEKIKINETLTDSEEAYVVANKIIDKRLSEHDEFDQFAILYRTNAQSRVFEEALRKRNIPYKIYGGMSFYQRKEIKDILAYCRLVVNKNDSEALKRIINYPKRGIGDSTMDKLETNANENNIPIWEVIKQLPANNLGLRSGTLNKINQFASLILKFTQDIDKKDAFELVSEIAKKNGMFTELSSDKTPEGISRFENLQELLNGIKEFVEQKDIPKEELTLVNFLEEVSLLTGNENESEEDKNRVSLMTVHSAKGLEFKNVFIVGLEEELFPSKMSSSTPDELEEERRLFYVAVTRAKNNLEISYARQRYRWGNLEPCSPSRFIYEIDEQYVDMPDFSSGDFDDTYEPPFARRQKAMFAKEPKSNAQEILKKRLENRQTPSPPLQNKKTPTRRDSGKIIQQQAKLKSLQSISENNKSQFKPLKQELKEGMRVEHQKFGYGTIKTIQGLGQNTKATIVFETAGLKTILLKFAKLRVLE